MWLLFICLLPFVFSLSRQGFSMNQSQLFWNLLGRLGWPQTYRDPPAFASKVLGLKIYTTITQLRAGSYPMPWIKLPTAWLRENWVCIIFKFHYPRSHHLWYGENPLPLASTIYLPWPLSSRIPVPWVVGAIYNSHWGRHTSHLFNFCRLTSWGFLYLNSNKKHSLKGYKTSMLIYYHRNHFNTIPINLSG